jgi:hypothetical protein
MKNYDFPILSSQRSCIADFQRVYRAAIRAGPAHIATRISVHRLRHIKPSEFPEGASKLGMYIPYILSVATCSKENRRKKERKK